MRTLGFSCEDCGRTHLFDVQPGEDPDTADGLRELIVNRLGRDGAYICSRCGSLVLIHVGDVPVAPPDRVERAEAAKRIGHKTRGIRFGVGDPNAAHSAAWRVWMNQRRDDVYISARSVASDLKVSLHPEFWYYGFTAPYAARVSPLPGGEGR